MNTFAKNGRVSRGLGDAGSGGTEMGIDIGVAPGIGVFDNVRWGNHICQLYDSDEDLIEVLIPYFKRGLESNALCLWLADMPLQQQVMEALCEGIPQFDQRRQEGQILAIPHTEWYLSGGRLSIETVLERAAEALHLARLRGFDGIWVAGDSSWFDRRDWKALVAYEERVCRSISGIRAVGLCCYPLRGLGVPEALDLYGVHRSVVLKREGAWVIVESLEHVKAEKVLLETERSYKHLFDATLDGIEVFDAVTGKILVANTAAARIFGFASPEQMVGLDPLDYIAPEDRERIAGLVAGTMFAEDSCKVMELRVLRADGREIWVSAAGVRTEYQGRLAGFVSIRDITRQREAEESLLESKRELQAVFDGVREGIALFDLTGRLKAVNKRVLEVGGYTADELVGRSFDQLDMFQPPERAKMLTIFAAVSSGNAVLPVEMEVVVKSGRRLTLHVGVTPLKKLNDVIGAVVVLRDVTKHKQAVELLRASEQRNRLLVENANEAILVVRDGVMQFANRKALEIIELLGYTVQEIKDRRLEEFFRFEERQRFREAREKRMAGEEFQDVSQFRIVGKAGQIRWMEMVAVHLTWDGKPATLVFLNDCTDRKRAEDYLRESEERYRLIAENSLDVIWTMDMSLCITYVSPSIKRLTGYTAQEFMALTMDKGMTLTSAQAASHAFAEGLAALERNGGRPGPPITMELEVNCKDGATVWTEATLSFMQDCSGAAVGIMGSARNINERRRAQMALKESERRYRLLAENVTDVIWVTDVDLRPTYVSPSIQRLMGFGAEESLFRGLEDALSPASAEKVRETMSRLLVAGEDGHESGEVRNPVELELLRRDGSTVWVDTTVTVLRDDSGHPAQFMGVLRDITRRKKAEEQLHQSLQKLERTLEGTIQAIRVMVDSRDRYTAGHQQRVTELACAIAEALGLPPERIHALHVAGLLHDVGKILLPTEILTKPGRLNEIEFSMIRTHPRSGYEILKSIEFPWPVARMVLQHHERLDGSGYPDGVQGEEIILESRILAVADVVEAMSSHRPYRAALGLNRALDEVARNKGVLYDPLVVDACVSLFRDRGFSFKTEAIADLY